MPTETTPPSVLDSSDTFVHRHIGPDDAEVSAMLAALGVPSLDALGDEIVPAAIRLERPLAITDAAGVSPASPRGEHELRIVGLHASDRGGNAVPVDPTSVIVRVTVE